MTFTTLGCVLGLACPRGCERHVHGCMHAPGTSASILTILKKLLQL